ncbi:MAG: TRAP transporter small permease [Deltaproteobacteria bacterium]|nr:TRAP transporter small permease [Deltaproteobacteria bacterium]MBW2016665.1 TRAP transporter small permease [Deltaproteobacteria bacterium]MBW2129152.1 TRAP transporter small permease [Deltaproteobacteria bacterium]
MLIKMLGTLGGLAIGAMMLLILAEVLSRLFLGSSIEGTIEIVGMSLALAVFLGFAPCEQSHDHVRVELLRSRLKQRPQLALDIATYLLALLTVGVMTWQVGLDAYSSLLAREVLPGAELEVPVYPAKISAFIGFMAFGGQLLINLCKLFKGTNSSRFARDD